MCVCGCGLNLKDFSHSGVFVCWCACVLCAFVCVCVRVCVGGWVWGVCMWAMHASMYTLCVCVCVWVGGWVGVVYVGHACKHVHLCVCVGGCGRTIFSVFIIITA